MKQNCVACDEIESFAKNSAPVIFANDFWLVSHQIGEDVLPGNLIIKTRRHCEHLAELTTEESASLGETIQKVCLAVSNVLKPEKIYVASYGEGIKHVHFFITPRLSSQPAGNLKNFIYQRLHSFLVKIKIRKKFTAEEKLTLITELKEQIKQSN